MLTRLILVLLLVAVSTAARAELPVGSAAPAFSLAAARGGNDFEFKLAEALRKGPVVVYFFPKAFSKVCTEEAHLFAEAMAEFEAVAATVIGISTDTIATQREFSRLECRDKFPVGADPDGQVAKAYDALRPDRVMASRTSYVITPDGKIAAVHSASDAESHIRTALDVARSWKASHGG